HQHVGELLCDLGRGQCGIARRPAAEVLWAIGDHIADVVGPARHVEVRRAARAPRRLEQLGVAGALLASLDPEAVPDVDLRAVDGVRAVVAAVVGAHHADARRVIRRQVDAVMLAPRLVAEPDALADRAAGAGERDEVIAGGLWLAIRAPRALDRDRGAAALCV